jgi:hypothetical protein
MFNDFPTAIVSVYHIFFCLQNDLFIFKNYKIYYHASILFHADNQRYCPNDYFL